MAPAGAGRAPDAAGVEAFEAAALAAAGLGFAWSRRGTAARYFAHIFAGGYTAGYYSYIWSEVLDADTVEWFRRTAACAANGDMLPRANCCPAADSVDPLEAYARVLGRPPRVEPLLERRGLTPVG